MLERVTRLGWLLDFYGPLLTERQRAVAELHLHHDLSLGEIAEQHGVSRQAVHEHLSRAAEVLEAYEARLGLAARHRERQAALAELDGLLRELAAGDRVRRELVDRARDLVRRLAED